MNKVTIGIAVGIILFGFVFYGTITWIGGKLMEGITSRQEGTEMTGSRSSISKEPVS